ncbi:hypothetical protein SUGI_0579070 [Cryptomeria japonica]|nr:hypothetical protein SUGI_0579070 [Cryptomeria japonica]
MDKENWKQTTNVVHYLLLHPNPSPYDPIFLHAHSISFQQHHHDGPFYNNYYFHALKTKVSSCLNKIWQFRLPGKHNSRTAAGIEIRYRSLISAEEEYVTRMLPIERKRKPPVFGRPPTWTFIIPNIMLLLYFYYKMYVPD